MAKALATQDYLTQLKEFTIVVADTGDFASMKAFAPHDATTNPTLILKAVTRPEYEPLLERAISKRNSALAGERALQDITDHLLVEFGREILRIIPGRVSTEVDARLSFDVVATIEKARRIIALYEDEKIPRERVLIKIASTWEGVQAARALESDGIHCNMTLLFCLPQAVVCADAGATLVSPFVGRILDWYREKTGREFESAEDPGVQSVTRIYNYFKKFGHQTEVMGASFRNIGEIIELAGCDLLTISPNLLSELQEESGPIERKLSPEIASHEAIQTLELDETAFRWHLNEDPMATSKLAEGIRLFAADTVQLEQRIEEDLLD